ncbi:MAG TPA: hypothetical protein VHS33_02455 [Sphingomicrobium sp.]|jgi:hypothetical protein|nr:hypothetical protein [Sphingomicrobium sp.]
MDEKLIEHIRDRVQRIRKIASMAHDPEMIAMLLKLAEEGEADLRRLEERVQAPGEIVQISPTLGSSES